MIVFFPIILLFVASAALFVVHRLKPRFRFFWLLATASTILAWPVLFLARLYIPSTIPIISWEPIATYPNSPAFIIDVVSWGISLALVTMTLAALLTDVANRESTEIALEWSGLASCLAITAIGLLSILSANLLTLLLTWAAMDLIELLIWLGIARSRDELERVVISFSTRIGGLFVAIIAGIIARASGMSLELMRLSPQIAPFLLIAAGLRLQVLPASTPLPRNLPASRNFRTVVKLAPAAVGLMLVSRSAFVGVSGSLSLFLLVIIFLSAAYGGLSWVGAQDELDGLPFFVITAASLSVAAAILAQPTVSFVWSIGIILSGPLLFFNSLRNRWLLSLPLIGAISLSTLPLTPTWQAVNLYTPPSEPIVLIFLIPQGLLLAGYLRHSLKTGMERKGVDRWVWIIFPWGLSLLIFTSFFITYWGLFNAGEERLPLPGLLASLSGIAATGFAIILVQLQKRSHIFSSRLVQTLLQIISIQWFYRWAWRFYLYLNRVFRWINVLLEGRAGVLWALLFVALLASLLFQWGLGG